MQRLYTPHQISEFTGPSSRSHSQWKNGSSAPSYFDLVDLSIDLWVPTAKTDVYGYTMQQRQSHKNLSKAALNQLTSLRIVIAVFNMEQ